MVTAPFVLDTGRTGTVYFHNEAGEYQMKLLLLLAACMIVACGAASATPVLYNITETFTVSAYFTGTFVFDAATGSLGQLQGSVSQGGSGIALTYDFNDQFGISAGLQADGSGGVTDTVCNGAAGYACVYLDILASSPTSLHTVTHLGTPSNRFVNSDIPISGPVSSYSISPAAIPEPPGWGLMVAGLAALGWLATRRPRMRGADDRRPVSGSGAVRATRP